ncbi:hypothetical protein [Pseudoalteromonas sp. Ld20]|uniref:hypothetical protein n=1 Tax=Pseudoalteromonas sp. Ld20 TaxID=649165 RepID=UPI003863B2FB
MKLKQYIEVIKTNQFFNNKGYTGNFPNPSTLEEKPHQHLKIIVEQGELLLKAFEDPTIMESTLGVTPITADLERICEIFTNDIEQFATKFSELKLIEGLQLFAQDRIPSYTLFTLARENLLQNTYEQHIDLLNQKSVYNLYSIPFLLRLAIENKLKAMIGFDSSKAKLSDNQTKISDQFPALKVINFLKDSDFVKSPLPFNELKKVYNWSCKFVHTGQKEYIWMSLKATSHLNILFSREHSNYLGESISYLKDGVTIADLQQAINSSTSFSQPHISKVIEESIELNLEEYQFDMTNSFWDNRTE